MFMGTSGNREGYKVFSFNTTIRNPKRNDDFLAAFKKYDGMVMNERALRSYLCDCVQKGIYKFKVVSSDVKKKWENNQDLTEEEIDRLIIDNPQAPGLTGRVMTQLRALKDQGFLIFNEVSHGLIQMRISALGRDLLNGVKSADDIYTKAMIGMQANSPARVSILNESRPFLNTLFVINELRRLSDAKGVVSKGLHPHEFSVFVLSMTDCDYEQAAKDIMLYRSKFKHEYNHKYCKEYLRQKAILPLAESSLKRDYPDDVFRKFEMTGLIVKRGSHKYQYYDFSSYNFGKIQSILSLFSGYKWERYSSIEEYYNSLSRISLPWEKSNTVKKRVVEMKATVLGIPYDQTKTIEQNEEVLDRVFYTNALKRAIDGIELDKICRELLILSGRIKAKSDFDDISESLRLEYMLALILGKRYGTAGLISNILYNEDGKPLHCAAAGKFDIMFYSEEGTYILEPTMLSSRDQQINSETTNVARHAREEEHRLNTGCRVMMIAPRVHSDVTDFFRYKVISDNVKMVTLSIERSVGLFMDSGTIPILNDNYDTIINDLKTLGCSEFADKVNQYQYAV